MCVRRPQVTTLQREVAALRDSLHAKDRELASAEAVGSGQVLELEQARQELSLKLEAAQQKMEVT